MLYDPTNANDYYHPWNQFGYHGQMRRRREEQVRQAYPPRESTTADVVTVWLCIYSAVCLGVGHVTLPAVGGVMFAVGVEIATGAWIYHKWRNRRS